MQVYITVGYRNYKKIFDFSINYAILIIMRMLTKKYLSIFLSLALIFCSVESAFSAFEKSENNTANIINKDILNLFKITDSYNSNNGSLVILIQDLHNNYETQEKIYKALKELTKKHNFEIYSEGVVDNKLDVSILNSISNKRIKEETIDNLFKSSVLSACEYFALSNNNSCINGIENKKEYVNNLLLLEIINRNKEFNNYIIDMTNIYIAAYKEFNNYIVNNIIKQVDELKKQSIIDRVLSLQILELNDTNIPDNFPNLQKYQTVSKNLSNINSKRLNSQFKDLVSNTKNSTVFYDLLKIKSDYAFKFTYI